MQRHEFLRRVHRRLRPRTYLEVGVHTGASLRLSRSRTVGIDPAFTITHPLRCNLALYKTTSDEYFARDIAFKHFGTSPVDLAFIDGMHLAEFALRDFINIEQRTSWASVVVFDDMLPRTVDEAARERRTSAWAGDVYKVFLTLREYRPDLLLIPVDTRPTGVLVVLATDPKNGVLANAYPNVERQYTVGDPQFVPDEILTRSCAFEPRKVLAAPFWEIAKAGQQRTWRGRRRHTVSALVDSVRSALFVT